MKTRVTPCAVQAQEGDGRVLRALISAETVDREDKVLLAAGVELGSYLRNPVLLWSHLQHLPPIGRALSIEPEPGVGVWAENEFAPTPFAQEIAELYRGGYLHAFSVGFRPLEIERRPRHQGQRGPTVVRWELIEQSAVAVPANPDALVTAAGEGNRAADWLLKTYYRTPDDEALLLKVGLDSQTATWPEVAAACYRFHGARGGVQLTLDERDRLRALLMDLYDHRGYRFPDTDDRHEPTLRATVFHHDEPQRYEEREMAELAALLRGRALALRNIARKRRRRGEPVPELDPLHEAGDCLAELLGTACGDGDPSVGDAGHIKAALADLRADLDRLGREREAAVGAALETLRRGAIGGR